MAKRVNPATVGAFVLGAIGLIIVAVVIFGSGRLFHKTHEFVVYFGGNGVNGLRAGAPVKFKGVEIGQVARIRLRLDQSVNRKNGQISADVRIPVVIELDEEKILSHGGGSIDLDDPHTIPNLIKEGLRASLGTDSFVTGLLYVALDMDPKSPIQMVAPPGSPLQEIPAVPTAFEEAQAMAVRVVENLEKVDFARVFREMSETLASVNQIVSSPELKQTISNSEKTRKELGDTLVSVRQTFSTADSQIKPLSTSLQKASVATDAAVTQAKSTLGTVQTTIEPGSPLNYQMVQTLQDVSAAARAIKELADLLQRDPSAIVRGRDVSRD